MTFPGVLAIMVHFPFLPSLLYIIPTSSIFTMRNFLDIQLKIQYPHYDQRTSHKRPNKTSFRAVEYAQDFHRTMQEQGDLFESKCQWRRTTSK